MTHFENCISLYTRLTNAALEFGHEALLALRDEHKTIRDISIALCGNSGLEDKIGRYIMAAEFKEQLNPQVTEIVRDWLSPSHYTELRKHELAYDHEAALAIMQELITELPNGQVTVKPAEWIRAQRDNQDVSPTEMRHRFWRVAVKMLAEMQSEMARLGKLATAEDKKRYYLLKAAVRLFQAKKEQN